MQALKQIFVAGHITTVEKRDGEFDVLLVKLIALGQRARGRSKFHPQVPQFLAEAADRVTHRVFRTTIGMQEENVNVGVRKQ